MSNIWKSNLKQNFARWLQLTSTRLPKPKLFLFWHLSCCFHHVQPSLITEAHFLVWVKSRWHIQMQRCSLGMLLKLLVASKNKKLTKTPLTNKQTYWIYVIPLVSMHMRHYKSHTYKNYCCTCTSMLNYTKVEVPRYITLALQTRPEFKKKS